jgi:hypothetical protein
VDVSRGKNVEKSNRGGIQFFFRVEDLLVIHIMWITSVDNMRKNTPESMSTVFTRIKPCHMSDDSDVAALRNLKKAWTDSGNRCIFLILHTMNSRERSR